MVSDKEIDDNYQILIVKIIMRLRRLLFLFLLKTLLPQ